MSNLNEGRKPAEVHGGETGGPRIVGSGRTGKPTWTPGKKKELKSPGQKAVKRTRSKERSAREKAMGKPNLPESYQALGRLIFQEMNEPSDSEVKKTAKADAKENKKKGSPEDREFAGKVKKAMGKKKVGQGIDNLKRDIRAAGARGKAKLDKQMQSESYGKGHEAGMKASKGAKSNKEQISKYLKARKKAGDKEKGSLKDVKTGLVGKTRK